MNCTAARDLLPGLLYDDLTPAEAVRLREHLGDCPACAAELTALRRVRRSLDTLPTPAADWMRTRCPARVSSSTPAGVMATRYSSGLISFGTPTIMGTSRAGKGRPCPLSRGVYGVSSRTGAVGGVGGGR